MNAATTKLEKAKEALFGKDGLSASNVKLFPGSDRDASAEHMAEEIVDSLDRVANGQAEEVFF